MTRAALPSDFAFVHGLYMHPQVNPYLLYEPMDSLAFQPIFDQLCDAGVLFVFEHQGAPVGMFKFVRQEHRCDHIAYLGGLAIDPAHSGKGFGNLMMREIVALGAQLGLRRIELSTAVTNDKAIALYEKHGFQKEGILRNYTHLKSENRFLDEVMMSLLY